METGMVGKDEKYGIEVEEVGKRREEEWWWMKRSGGGGKRPIRDNERKAEEKE